MKNTTLLVIEGRHAEIPSFASDLQKKGFDVVTVQNGSQAIPNEAERGSLVVVMHIVRSTGIRICLSVRKKDPRYQSYDRGKGNARRP